MIHFKIEKTDGTFVIVKTIESLNQAVNDLTHAGLFKRVVRMDLSSDLTGKRMTVRLPTGAWEFIERRCRELGLSTATEYLKILVMVDRDHEILQPAVKRKEN